LVAVLVLALVYGTRWCILYFYEGSFTSTGQRSVEQQMLFAAPSSVALPHEEEASARMSPPTRLP
jgi:hypothetical protein